MNPGNKVWELSFDLALIFIGFSGVLEEKRKNVIARQKLKAGKRIGANVREAQSCESRADFVQNPKISHKEAEKTEYGLLLCEKAKSHPYPAQNKSIPFFHSNIN